MGSKFHWLRAPSSHSDNRVCRLILSNELSWAAAKQVDCFAKNTYILIIKVRKHVRVVM